MGRSSGLWDGFQMDLELILIGWLFLLDSDFKTEQKIYNKLIYG